MSIDNTNSLNLNYAWPNVGLDWFKICWYNDGIPERLISVENAAEDKQEIH